MPVEDITISTGMQKVNTTQFGNSNVVVTANSKLKAIAPQIRPYVGETPVGLTQTAHIV